MNPQTPSYLDPWSIFLLLSQTGAMGKAVRQAESKYDRSGSTAVHVKSTATTERLNLRTFFFGFCPVKFWLAHWSPLPEAEIVHSKMQSLTDWAKQTLQNSLDIEHGIRALWRRCLCSVSHNKFERLFGQSPVGIWKTSCSEFWVWMLFAAHWIIIGFRNQHQQHSALHGPVPVGFGSVSIPENCAHAVPKNMTSEHCNQLSSCKAREGLAAVVQFILYQWFQIAQLDVSQAAIAQNHSPPIPVSAKVQMPALLSSKNRSLAPLQ